MRSQESAFENSLGMDVGMTREYGNRTGFFGELAEPSDVTSHCLVAPTGFGGLTCWPKVDFEGVGLGA